MNSQLIFDVGRFERNDLSQLFAAFIWEKTLPDRFVGIAGFAFGILLPHSFQCKQRAIAPMSSPLTALAISASHAGAGFPSNFRVQPPVSDITD